MCVFIFIEENHDYHQFAGGSSAYHHGAQKSFLASQIEKCQSVFQCITAYFIANFIRIFGLQPAFVYVQYFVKLPWNMKTNCIHGFKHFAIRNFFVGTPALIRESEFQFVAVKFGACRTQNRRYFWQFYFANPCQVINNLFLFVSNLFGIGEDLPFTSTANAIMFANCFRSLFGIIVKMNWTSFHKMTFLTCHL